MLSVIEITSRPPIVSPLMADWKQKTGDWCGRRSDDPGPQAWVERDGVLQGREKNRAWDTYYPDLILLSQNSLAQIP